MKVGIVSEGQSEVGALPCLYPRLQPSCPGMQILRPLFVGFAPTAPPGAIARACLSRVEQLRSKGVDCVIVLTDREQRPECPGSFASSIEEALRVLTPVAVHVVVKNRCFENWLVADVDALRQQPARFEVSSAVIDAVQPDKADNVDGLKLLKQVTKGKAYSKVEDSRRICQKADPMRIAKQSRSFRRFLRCLGHQAFQDQSRLRR